MSSGEYKRVSSLFHRFVASLQETRNPISYRIEAQQKQTPLNPFCCGRVAPRDPTSAILPPHVLFHSSHAVYTRHATRADFRKRIKLAPEKAIFIFVDDILPPTAALMSSIYEEHK